VNPAVIWILLICALGAVVVRRRSVAIVLTGLQSLVLGAQALSQLEGRTDLAVAAILLIVKGLALPVLLLAVMRRTREPLPIRSDRHPVTRLACVLVPVLAVTLLTPELALSSRGVQDGGIALLTLGIAIAAVRRGAIFQVLGFLIAENGLYLIALGSSGGLPALIELGLGCDLILVVAVAAAFGVRIHRELGTADTTLLSDLRD